VESKCTAFNCACLRTRHLTRRAALDLAAWLTSAARAAQHTTAQHTTAQHVAPHTVRSQLGVRRCVLRKELAPQASTTRPMTT
jgi:hypothetical protein